MDLDLDVVPDPRRCVTGACRSAGWSLTRARPLDNHGDPLHLKIPPNHESAVNTMAVDDDAQQQPGNAAANGGQQGPASAAPQALPLLAPLLEQAAGAEGIVVAGAATPPHEPSETQFEVTPPSWRPPSRCGQPSWRPWSQDVRSAPTAIGRAG